MSDTRIVVIVEGGQVFHKNAACLALLDGQLKAARSGQQSQNPRRIQLNAAIAEGRTACERCFPDFQPG